MQEEACATSEAAKGASVGEENKEEGQREERFGH